MSVGELAVDLGLLALEGRVDFGVSVFDLNEDPEIVVDGLVDNEVLLLDDDIVLGDSFK